MKENMQPHELEKEIARLSQRLQEQQQQLKACEKMALLGQLVAGIAHEINTPLGALKSNYDTFIRCLSKIEAALFAEQAPPEIRENQKLRSLFDNINKLNSVNKDASQRIVEIVNAVRRYASHDEPEPVEADIHEILNSTLAIVYHKLKNRVEIHRHYGASQRIKCFPNKLYQVFLNIIVNSVYAITGKGEISICTEDRPGELYIEIRDSGCGIPADKLDRIFETGFTTRKSGEGMGLGLALVKEIIEQHRGSISADSTPGKGTTFRIRLPRS